MTTSNEETTIDSSDEQKLESSTQAWLETLEDLETLVETMTKKQLRRAVKKIYAAPLEDDRVDLISQDERQLYEFFRHRDIHKLNISLAYMAIEGKKLKEMQEEQNNKENENE